MYMQRHVDTELIDLKDLLLTMGGCVERAVDEAHLALMNGDEAHFTEVVAQETLINKLHSKVDKQCLRLLARQAPVASDLRLVLAIIKSNSDLERMGDQTMNICLNAKDYIENINVVSIPAELQEMKKETRYMVKSALDAFVKQDIELSEKVLLHDDVVDNYKEQLELKFTENIKADPSQTESFLCLISIAKNLERIADHATNIVENNIFVITGKDIRHGRSSKIFNHGGG